MYDLNQRDVGLATFLALKNPVLNFLNFLSSGVLLSYKPLSYKKNIYCRYFHGFFQYSCIFLSKILLLLCIFRLWNLPTSSNWRRLQTCMSTLNYQFNVEDILVIIEISSSYLFLNEWLQHIMLYVIVKTDSY